VPSALTMSRGGTPARNLRAPVGTTTAGGGLPCPREHLIDLRDAFLLVLNVGAIVGLLIAGTVADRIGARAAGIAWFAGAAVFLGLLSIRLPIGGIYLMVFLTGCFVFSAQVLVYAFVSANHPPQVRATALGWSAGAGRIGAIVGPVITGALFAAGNAFPGGFYLFAVVGALGAIAFSVTRRRV
jgi:MFS transporter, AAHS family, benzoate transport protein